MNLPARFRQHQHAELLLAECSADLCDRPKLKNGLYGDAVCVRPPLHLSTSPPTTCYPPWMR